MLPDGLNCLCYFAGTSKRHREISISFISLESPHQVDMKNVAKSFKHFFGYFNTLETHSDQVADRFSELVKFISDKPKSDKFVCFINHNCHLIYQ